MEDSQKLSVLGAQYNPEILSVAGKKCSAREISERVDIPTATCYRRIEELNEAGFLKFEGRELTDDRRRTNVYQRTIEEIRVRFDEEDETFEVETKERSLRRQLDDVWRTLSRPSL